MKNLPLDHPIFPLIKYGLTLITLLVALKIFASEFDSTEWNSFFTFAGTLGIGKGLEVAVKQFVKKDTSNE